MSVTATLNATVTLSDNSANVTSLSTIIPGLTFTGTVFAEETLSIGASPTSVTLPVATCHVAIIQNTHASQTLQVTWTPASGVSAVIQTLEPNSTIILLQAATGAGITALSLLGSGAGTTCKVILVG